MKRTLTMLCAATLLASFCAGAAEMTMSAEVDARDLPRRLLHTRMDFPASPGELALWYPKWVPGIHAPYGPIQNTAGIRFETPDGTSLEWERDPHEYYRIVVQVPKGVDRVIGHMDYICNQPSTNSIGVDSYGYALLGVINWNTCLLYPEGFTNSEIQLDLKLRLPENWRHASALTGEKNGDGWTIFNTATLRTVVDSPLIAGEHFRSIELDTGDGPAATLDLVAGSDQALQLEDETIEQHGKLFREAYALYDGAPFDRYNLLVVLSDEIPGIGLEHLRSSLNAVDERSLVDEDMRKDRVAYLLAHEVNHAWIGKFRRPAGMNTGDYHSPKDTKLLWIYEGLDQYLGEVLMVRAGIVPVDEYMERFAYKLLWLTMTEGREWRPLEDTATFAGPLRGGSRSWGQWRRGQDYYNEGLVIWLEIDAYIRKQTDNKFGLDEFCKRFLEPQKDGQDVVPFELTDVVSILNEVAPRDWEAFFAERTQKTQENLPLDFVKLLGYRVEYSNEPSDYREDREDDRGYVSALETLGMDIARDGDIYNVIKNKLADQAGLAPGMRIAGVNGRKYTTTRMRDAIAESATKRQVELLLLEGDVFKEVALPYDGGPRYLTLVRDDENPDRFEAILNPTSNGE